MVENRAIFTSHIDRNLNILIKIWKEKVFKKDKSIKPFSTPSDLIDNNFNIFLEILTITNQWLKICLNLKYY